MPKKVKRPKKSRRRSVPGYAPSKTRARPSARAMTRERTIARMQQQQQQPGMMQTIYSGMGLGVGWEAGELATDEAFSLIDNLRI